MSLTRHYLKTIAVTSFCLLACLACSRNNNEGAEKLYRVDAGEMPFNLPSLKISNDINKSPVDAQDVAPNDPAVLNHLTSENLTAAEPQSDEILNNNTNLEPNQIEVAPPSLDDQSQPKTGEADATPVSIKPDGESKNTDLPSVAIPLLPEQPIQAVLHTITTEGTPFTSRSTADQTISPALQALLAQLNWVLQITPEKIGKTNLFTWNLKWEKTDETILLDRSGNLAEIATLDRQQPINPQFVATIQLFNAVNQKWPLYAFPHFVKLEVASFISYLLDNCFVANDTNCLNRFVRRLQNLLPAMTEENSKAPVNLNRGEIDRLVNRAQKHLQEIEQLYKFADFSQFADQFSLQMETTEAGAYTLHFEEDNSKEETNRFILANQPTVMPKTASRGKATATIQYSEGLYQRWLADNRANFSETEDDENQSDEKKLAKKKNKAFENIFSWVSNAKRSKKKHAKASLIILIANSQQLAPLDELYFQLNNLSDGKFDFEDFLKTVLKGCLLTNNFGCLVQAKSFVHAAILFSNNPQPLLSASKAKEYTAKVDHYLSMLNPTLFNELTPTFSLPKKQKDSAKLVGQMRLGKLIFAHRVQTLFSELIWDLHQQPNTANGYTQTQLLTLLLGNNHFNMLLENLVDLVRTDKINNDQDFEKLKGNKDLSPELQEYLVRFLESAFFAQLTEDRILQENLSTCMIYEQLFVPVITGAEKPLKAIQQLVCMP